MDPHTDLRLADQRRAEFERRAATHRLARSLRRRPAPQPDPVARRTRRQPARPAVDLSLPACCPA